MAASSKSMSVLLEVAGLRLHCWIQSKYCCLRHSCFHTCRESTVQRSLLPLNLQDLDITNSSKKELCQQRNTYLSHSIAECIAATCFDNDASVPVTSPCKSVPPRETVIHINWSKIFENEVFYIELSLEWTCCTFVTWTCSICLTLNTAQVLMVF